MPKRAVILLSGGLDSATTLAIAKREGFACYALSFRYGQRHGAELDAARRVAQHLGAAEHVILDIDLRQFGGSALTSDIPVPKDRIIATSPAALGRGAACCAPTNAPDAIPGAPDTIPVTYVPARNTIFLSFALAWAEVLGAEAVFIGVNALDYSGYPDCRPEYIAAFQEMAHLATKAGVEGSSRLTIHTPLIQMTKAEIIRKGLELGVDFGMTLSCYDPDENGTPCGRCDACQLRAKGFAEVAS